MNILLYLLLLQLGYAFIMTQNSGIHQQIYQFTIPQRQQIDSLILGNKK